jgi:transcriptional regulator with XRE-family HTH domain
MSNKMCKTSSKTLAHILREIIDALGMSDIAFAQRVGISRGTISNYLLGKSEPSWSTLAAIVKEFGIEPSRILTGEGPMFQPTPGDAAHPQPSPGETLLEREMRAIEDRLTRLGAEKREVVEAIKAHLGVGADTALAGRGPGLAARDRDRDPGRRQTAEGRGTSADQEKTVKE